MYLGPSGMTGRFVWVATNSVHCQVLGGFVGMGTKGDVGYLAADVSA
jgi:hypothetical protein